MPSSRVMMRQQQQQPLIQQQQQSLYGRHNQQQQPPTDLAELVSLVSAQQSTLYSQQAEIKHCDDESNYLEQQPQQQQQQQQHQQQQQIENEKQIELVLSEVRRLEEVALRYVLCALLILHTILPQTSASQNEVIRIK